MSEQFLRAKLASIARKHPETRAHLVPLLQKTADIETSENQSIRWNRKRNSLKVWDLTNAGMRGKTVDMFYFWDLDFLSPELEARVTDYQKDLNGMNYAQAKAKAMELVELGVKFQADQERGVDVTPPGFKPLKLETPEFSLEVNARAYTVRDKRDQNNLPALFNKGTGDVARFRAWVLNNLLKVKKIKYTELVSLMMKEGFKFHDYYRMD